jgi:hypothetical protein
MWVGCYFRGGIYIPAMSPKRVEGFWGPATGRCVGQAGALGYSHNALARIHKLHRHKNESQNETQFREVLAHCTLLDWRCSIGYARCSIGDTQLAPRDWRPLATQNSKPNRLCWIIEALCLMLDARDGVAAH